MRRASPRFWCHETRCLVQESPRAARSVQRERRCLHRNSGARHWSLASCCRLNSQRPHSLMTTRLHNIGVRGIMI